MNILKFFSLDGVSNKEDNKTESLGLKLSGKALEKEIKKYKEIADKTIIEAKESGFFKDEFLPILSERIESVSQLGYAYTDPFNKTDCLSLEEKKSLNLNTRAKYSRELINGLTEKGISEAGSNKDFMKNMFLRNFHKVSRKYDLEHLKELGIKFVIISDCDDERDCKAIKKLKKKWPIDEVPELPLPQCDAAYCRCTYLGDYSEDFNE